ncbi:MAG: hypothetical protein IJ132_01630 [Firmicutes bacterium]|nr:hypothetical protein [Bacillota bacterium]
MDKKKGILNISASIASRIILLVVALYVRRLLIFYIGNEVNGLNSLYGSIIGLLSVAELGVGSAIVFSMYSPIVNKDKQKITALYCLYRKLYRIIGAVILVAGLVVMPFLPKLISDYGDLDINVYVTFMLTLASVVISYLYSAKTSLIEAHKDNYITTGITTVSRMIRYALQIATIIIWKSFVIFLVCQIIETLIVWYLTERAVKKLHPDIISLSKGKGYDSQPAVDLTLDSDTRKDVTKSIKAMFMHKIGVILVGAVDSMVISMFIGVTILGKYTNYTAISAAMTGIIALFFTPMTTVIGHLCAAGNTDETKKYFDYFYTLNYVLGVVFFLGYCYGVTLVKVEFHSGHRGNPPLVTIVF